MKKIGNQNILENLMIYNDFQTKKEKRYGNEKID